MNFILIVIVLVISCLSFYGGVWLWRELSQNLHFSIQKLLSGVVLLTLSCVSVSGFLYYKIHFDSGIKDLIYSFVLILALSLCYNCGYVFSILPSRAKFEKFTGFRFPALILLPISAGLLMVVAIKGFGVLFLIPSMFLGVLSFLSGFSIWEYLRMAEAFKDNAFRQVLWKLSVSFVSLSFIVVFSGLASFYHESFMLLTANLILVIFISLSFYCFGLIYALLRH